MDTEAWMKTILDILLILVGIPGNLLIILVYATKGTRISAHVFIIGLAIADFFVCFMRPLSLFNNIPQLIQIKNSSEVLCKLQYFLKYIAMFTSIILTGGIAVDRYFAVCKPHGHIMTVFRAKLAIGFCFILSLILSIPPLIIFGIVVYPHYGSVCSPVTPEWTVSFLLTPLYVVASTSLAVIVVLYARIYVAVRHRIKVTATGSNIEGHVAYSSTTDEEGTSAEIGTGVVTMNSSSQNDNNQEAARIPSKRPKSKTTKMLFITTVVFVITWIPSIATMATRDSQDALRERNQAAYLVVIFLSKLLLINHAVNPFIYGIVSQRFRDDAKQILQKLKRWMTKQ